VKCGFLSGDRAFIDLRSFELVVCSGPERRSPFKCLQEALTNIDHALRRRHGLLNADHLRFELAESAYLSSYRPLGSRRSVHRVVALSQEERTC